jgi:uncharacterized repeat protein (TIGR01451 family)
LQLPNGINYENADMLPISIAGNEYQWDMGDIAPGDQKTVHIFVLAPNDTPLGTAFNFSGDVKPLANDLNIPDNFFHLHVIVVGSYDPNDKQVAPAYVTPGMLANGSPFQYTIHFQNTGNYPADFVRVVDTLGQNVDPATFRLLAASHPVSWKMRGAGVVEFLFENINLPSSSANFDASQGFVQFSIQPKKDLPLGTVIRNFCDIYFDYNDPVRTNTAGTQVVYFIPGTGLATQDALRIRPNPAAFFIYCDWKTPAPANGRIRLFDTTGLPKLEIPVEEGQTGVNANVSNLPPGLYFGVLESGNLLLTNKVVVVPLPILGGN